jgi:hypothetical protein
MFPFLIAVYIFSIGLDGICLIDSLDLDIGIRAWCGIESGRCRCWCSDRLSLHHDSPSLVQTTVTVGCREDISHRTLELTTAREAMIGELGLCGSCCETRTNKRDTQESDEQISNMRHNIELR